jgi:YaiO family outer membrane protein
MNGVIPACRWILLLALLLSLPVRAEQTPAAPIDGLASAQRLLDRGDHEGALTELDSWLATYPDDAQARFLQARTLGWSGRYDEALKDWEALLNAYPGNVDYLLGKGQVLVWMGRADDALPILARARAIAPDYEELWRLELNARIASTATIPENRQTAEFAAKARARFPGADWAHYEPPSRARLDSGFIYDNLNNGYSSWKELYVAGNYRLTDRATLFGQARATERFSQSDQEVMAGVNLSVGDKWTLIADASVAPDAQVLPSWSLTGRAKRTLPRGFGIQAGWRHAEYALSRLDLMTAAGEYWFGNYRTGYTLYAASIDGGPLIYSHRGQLDRYYRDRSRVSLIASNGEEVESIGNGFFVVNEVQTLTLTGQHWLSQRWALTWELGQAWTTLYDKQRFRAGFTRQF